MSAQDVIAVVGGLTEFVERKVKKIVIGIAANLQSEPPQGTPIDTGHATNNWVASLDEPYSGIAGGPGEADGGPAATGIAQVASLKLPQTAYVSNNVPYISALDAGSSTQSPEGFVEAGILRAVREAVE